MLERAQEDQLSPGRWSQWLKGGERPASKVKGALVSLYCGLGGGLLKQVKFRQAEKQH